LVLLAAAAKALIIKATNQQNIILATLEILIFNIYYNFCWSLVAAD
jgi:hypothetical protein